MHTIPTFESKHVLIELERDRLYEYRGYTFQHTQYEPEGHAVEGHGWMLIDAAGMLDWIEPMPTLVECTEWVEREAEPGMTGGDGWFAVYQSDSVPTMYPHTRTAGSKLVAIVTEAYDPTEAIWVAARALNVDRDLLSTDQDGSNQRFAVVIEDGEIVYPVA